MKSNQTTTIATSTHHFNVLGYALDLAVDDLMTKLSRPAFGWALVGICNAIPALMLAVLAS